MRLIIVLLGLLIPNQIFAAATVLVEIIHDSDKEIVLKDAALHEYLNYDPIFDFPDKTTFGLEDGSFTLLELQVGEEIYYLYMQGSFITIDLKSAKIKSDAYFLLKRKKDFFQTNVNGKWLLHLFEIEAFYKNILNKVDSLTHNDKNYGYSKLGVNYWDKKNAKKMLTYLKGFDYKEYDFKLRFNSPSFVEFARLLHSLHYQFSEKEIHTSLSIEDQYKLIQTEIIPELRDAVALRHFFRPSSPLVVMESALNVPDAKRLNERILFSAERATKRKRESYGKIDQLELDWLFGFDVDEALDSFFKKQDVRKPSLIIFWTTFGSAMDYEYDHLKELYRNYSQAYNFIYVCVNAFEQEQKAKAIIKREGLSGHHLFPKSADAFWKSEWKNKRINTLPFYVLVDAEEDLIDAVEIPLDFTNLLPVEMRNHLDLQKL